MTTEAENTSTKQHISQLLKLAGAHWLAQSIYVASQTGVPQILSRNGAQTASEIAAATHEIQNTEALE